MSDQNELTRLTMQVVAAYASKNPIRPTELESVMRIVRSSLEPVGRPPTVPTVSVEKLTPAQIRRSITPDALISFQDGKPYKQLKRHLTARGMTPADYRAKWGLPADYPMVAANASAARSAVAIASGFGKKAPSTRDIAQAPTSAPAPVAGSIARAPEPETAAAAVIQASETKKPAEPAEQAPVTQAPKARILGRLSLFGRRTAKA